MKRRGRQAPDGGRRHGRRQPSEAKAFATISATVLLPENGDEASLDWLSLLWRSEETCLARGEAVEETEGKIPRGRSGSAETQKPSKTIDLDRRLWRATEDYLAFQNKQSRNPRSGSRLCFHSFDFLHVLAPDLFQPTDPSNMWLPRKQPIALLSSSVNLSFSEIWPRLLFKATLRFKNIIILKIKIEYSNLMYMNIRPKVKKV